MAKILIAEDEKNLLDLFASVIEPLGHTVIKSANGKLAWEILDSNPDIAFLISDIAMPEMDGLALIKLLRQDVRFAKLSVLIASGAIRAKEISHLLEEGATYFMPKPLNIPELRELVKRHVQA